MAFNPNAFGLGDNFDNDISTAIASMQAMQPIAVDEVQPRQNVSQSQNVNQNQSMAPQAGGGIARAILGDTVPSAGLADALMKYEDTQNRRFGNSVAGGIEGIVDMFRAPKAREELLKEQETAAKAAVEQEMKEMDIRYADGRKVIEAKFGNKVSPEQKDALARQYASGAIDLKELIPEFETAKAIADRSRANRKEGREEHKHLVDIANIIRDDTQAHFDKYDATKIRMAQTMKNAQMIEAGEISGAADVTALYQLISGLDPESVVREGEIALVQRIIPQIKQVQLWAEGNLKGDMAILTPEIRQQLIDITNAMNEAHMESGRRLIGSARELAAANGVPENMVFGESLWKRYDDDQKAAAEAKVPPPPVNTSSVRTPEEEAAAKAAYEKQKAKLLGEGEQQDTQSLFGTS